MLMHQLQRAVSCTGSRVPAGWLPNSPKFLIYIFLISLPRILLWYNMDYWWLQNTLLQQRIFFFAPHVHRGFFMCICIFFMNESLSTRHYCSFDAAGCWWNYISMSVRTDLLQLWHMHGIIIILLMSKMIQIQVKNYLSYCMQIIYLIFYISVWKLDLSWWWKFQEIDFHFLMIYFYKSCYDHF